MAGIAKAYLNARESVHHIVSHDTQGQTMTEYALIVVAVAIVAFVTYRLMGQDVGSLVNHVNTGLASG